MITIIRISFLLSILIFINYVYFTVGRLDYISPQRIETQPDSSHFNFDLKFGHSMWTDKYFASDTVSDSIYLIHNPKQRDSALKPLKYWSLGGMSACGWRRIDYMSIPDSSKFKITGINYEGAKYGHLGFEIQCKDTGHSELFFRAKNDVIKTGLTIKSDTIIFDQYSSYSFERSRWFLPFLWIAQLWPFWPSF